MFTEQTSECGEIAPLGEHRANVLVTKVVANTGPRDEAAGPLADSKGATRG
jgi:hypothetical protein